MAEAWSLSMVLEGGEPSIFRPPDQGDLNISEISISLELCELPGPIGLDRKPGQCFLKASAIPSMIVKSTNIREKIQFMADHALIGKFIGLQPSEKDLIWWINSTWKPKGHFDLHLGSKGFLLFLLSA